MVNAGIMYFTSKTYRYMFVGGNPNPEADEVSYGWEIVQFLIFMVIIEHALLILKIFVEQIIEDSPLFVVRGERQRDRLIDNFKKKLPHADYFSKENFNFTSPSSAS